MQGPLSVVGACGIASNERSAAYKMDFGCHVGKKTMSGISSQWKPALAVVALLSSVVIAGAQQTANAADGANPARNVSMKCADRHWQLLTLIEYLGDAPDFAGDKLFKAQLAAMHARDICAQGHENAGLSLYDRAVLDLAFPVVSSR